MKKVWLFLLVSCLAGLLQAQNAPEKEPALTDKEAAAVASILAKSAQETAQPAPSSDKIILPEETKSEAFAQADTHTGTNDPEPPMTAEQMAAAADKEAPLSPSVQDEPTTEQPKEMQKCLTVAFIDIDEAFNEHPRTIAVKEQIRLKILSKENEVQGARQLINVLTAENDRLAAQLRELKPFYERIVVEPTKLQPQIQESADSLVLGNLLNRLTFSGAEILSTSPLNSPAELDDLTARIASNKKIIAERGFFIDNYKYTTREEILKLEKKEVNAILQDIYTEIKSFAKKRNIGAVVRKDEILYGDRPVNVTKDFISRLKKAKKYRQRGK
ncbi:hypothetical protein [Candidatus Avelusimicrobium fimicolum]|uniref:hypothetical protein n=1 Tax=Candidatus Avelusimicrobium fimicolum TaxID=3416216 RepID=UPI003D0A981B